MIEHPAPQNRGVRTSNHDRSLGSKRWLGRTEFLTLTIQSEPRLETRKPTDRAKWRSSLSAYTSVLENCLTAADIVRDGDLSTVSVRYRSILLGFCAVLSPCGPNVNRQFPPISKSECPLHLEGFEVCFRITPCPRSTRCKNAVCPTAHHRTSSICPVT
jgi:hypothetical protein